MVRCNSSRFVETRVISRFLSASEAPLQCSTGYVNLNNCQSILVNSKSRSEKQFSCCNFKHRKVMRGGRIAQWQSVYPRSKKSAVQALTKAYCCRGNSLFLSSSCWSYQHLATEARYIGRVMHSKNNKQATKSLSLSKSFSKLYKFSVFESLCFL